MTRGASALSSTQLMRRSDSPVPSNNKATRHTPTRP